MSYMKDIDVAVGGCILAILIIISGCMYYLNHTATLIAESSDPISTACALRYSREACVLLAWRKQ